MEEKQKKKKMRKTFPPVPQMTFLFRARRFFGIFSRAVEHGKRTAVVSDGVSFSYRDILHHSSTVAAAISSKGSDLQEARVCFLTPNKFEYIAVQWGIWRRGGVAVPLCVTHPPAEWEYVLSNSQCNTVICHSSFVPALLPIAEKLRIRFLTVSHMEGGVGEKSIGEDIPTLDESRGALMLYTSGTTGRPKGVITTHANLHHQAETMIEPWGWTKNDRLLHTLPLHHLHGVMNALFVPLWVGATVEMMGSFNANAVWQRFVDALPPPDGKKPRISLFFGVPTMYFKLLAEYGRKSEAEKQKCTQGAKLLRLMVSGSAALPTSILNKWREVSGHTLLERYGMTEIGMALSQSLEVSTRVDGTVGLPLPTVVCKIVSETGEECAADTPGELLVGGPSVFREYFGRPDATAEAFVDGFFKTGDVAVYEKETGSYRLLGRQSVDVIKTAGYKVSALEIERVLLEHPAIDEVAVLGLPDEGYGEIVVALIVPKEGQSPPELEPLRSWFASHAAPYKAPAKIKIIPELPRNAMGKINKKQLRETFFPKSS